MSQEFDNNVLDFVKQKVFYPYKNMSYFEILKKEKLSSLTVKKISDKNYECVLKNWNKSEMKTSKDYTTRT